jgi:hypothetical protein
MATTCDGPRLAAGNRPADEGTGACIRALSRGECGWDDMCGHCLGLGMVALDWVTGSDLPWSATYRIAADVATPKRFRLRTRVAMRIVGGAA